MVQNYKRRRNNGKHLLNQDSGQEYFWNQKEQRQMICYNLVNLQVSKLILEKVETQLCLKDPKIERKNHGQGSCGEK